MTNLVRAWSITGEKLSRIVGREKQGIGGAGEGKMLDLM